MSPVERIRAAAERRATADAEKRAATRELRAACLAAQAEGVSISQIARDANLSRQAVYDLLADPRSSEPSRQTRPA